MPFILSIAQAETKKPRTIIMVGGEQWLDVLDLFSGFFKVARNPVHKSPHAFGLRIFVAVVKRTQAHGTQICAWGDAIPLSPLRAMRPVPISKASGCGWQETAPNLCDIWFLCENLNIVLKKTGERPTGKFYERELFARRGVFRADDCDFDGHLWRLRGAGLMAKRFGGEFSPTGGPSNPDDREMVVSERLEVPSFKGRKPQRHGAKLNILFILPLLTLLTAFWQPVVAMTTDLAGAATLMLAAWLTRDGVRAEDAFNERRVARRPAIPRKIFGSVGTGLGVALLVFGGQWNPFTAVMAGIIAGGLHSASFGLDPLKDKGLEGVDRMQTDRVARKIEEAEKLLDQMTDAMKRARDRQLEARLSAFQDTVRQMFRQVEEDPRDLTQARKYLGVYLQGARDATVQFADLYARNRETEVRADYVAFLDDMESNFAKRTTAMLTDDRTNFDVEIEVLRDRLNRENFHIEG